jgi:hypothetical protein
MLGSKMVFTEVKNRELIHYVWDKIGYSNMEDSINAAFAALKRY